MSEDTGIIIKWSSAFWFGDAMVDADMVVVVMMSGVRKI